MYGEPKQNQGRGLVDRRLVQAPPPSNFIAGRVHFKLFSYCYNNILLLLLLSFKPQGESYILNRKKGVKNYDKPGFDNKYF